MIKVGIIGATGYTGAELVRLLARHPQVEIVAVSSQSYVGQRFDEVYPHLSGYIDLVCMEQDVPKMAQMCDVIFTAVPHGLSMGVAQEVLPAGKKLIDLGADFRFDDYKVYEEWYKVTHPTEKFIPVTAYGIPEINRAKIKSAQIVANAGCYVTSAILGLAPLLAARVIDPDSIIIDAKSGVSGAGRTASTGSLFTECDENFKAYNIGTHRHTPEIEQGLAKIYGSPVTVSFTPHLVPMSRGILSTIYSKLTTDKDLDEILAIYQKHYAHEPFIHILPKGVYPQTKYTTGSNHCFIGLTVDPRTNRVVVTSALDNLVKGASGQAIQNMNILFDLPETTGLDFPGMYP